jgi:hypothetical protein
MAPFEEIDEISAVSVPATCHTVNPTSSSLVLDKVFHANMRSSISAE